MATSSSTPEAFAGKTSILPRTGYIVSPAFDLFYFILSPLLGLLIIRAVVLTEFDWAISQQNLLGVMDSRVGFAIAVWTYAHLFAVVFRSHMNPQIFRQHRIRFVVVPIVLLVGFLTSGWVLAFGMALTWLWDVYHSSMQVFGFCRIYDSKMGSPAEKGRLLDVWMSHLVYIAPIFVGLDINPIFGSALREFRRVGLDLQPTVLNPILGVQTGIAGAIAVAGTVFAVYYVYAYWKMSQEGYRYSPQKGLMLVTTGCVNYYAWGFLHPVGAFFVINFFHGLQYFAMVWWSERKHITKTIGLSRFAWGHIVSLALFVVVVFGVGTWHKVEAVHGGGLVAISIATVISLMHFWYDGFIWSVRRNEV